MAFLKMEDINYLQESQLEDAYSKEINANSYFINSLNEISKLNNEYRESMKTFYRRLNENDSHLANTIFKDFVSAIASIIDKFDKCMMDNHSNYYSSLKRQMMNDRNKIVLDKNKISDIRANNIYNFTISREIPKPIGRDLYYNEVDKLQKILKNNSLSQDQKSMNLLFIYNELVDDLRGGFFDRFRGEILDIKKEISAIDYADTLFAIYRDGGNTISTVLEREDIIEIDKRFKDAKTYLISVERDRDNIIREYNRIKKDLNNIKLTDVASLLGSNAEEIDDKVQRYIRLKTEQLLNMCSIHTMAYTAKLDAVASLYMQDKAILCAVIDKYDASEDYVDDTIHMEGTSI